MTILAITCTFKISNVFQLIVKRFLSTFKHIINSYRYCILIDFFIRTMYNNINSYNSISLLKKMCIHIYRMSQFCFAECYQHILQKKIKQKYHINIDS